MTTERAIEIFKYINENRAFGVVSVDGEEYHEALDMAINALEKQKWIPCSERLPKYTDNYLVTVGVGDELGYWEETNCLRFERFRCCEPRWVIPYNPYNVYTVLAWMPLPEPYKG